VENLIKIGFQLIERELPAVFFSFKRGWIVSAGATVNKGTVLPKFDVFLIYNLWVE
jgi:hypothetical protein